MSTPSHSQAALERLPLRAGVLAVLAALGNGPAPGIAILEQVEAAGRGARVLGPGTLYRLLRELRAEGLIARTEAPEREGEGDERRQFHALTHLGRAVLEAEAARLRRTLADSGLLAPGPGG
jgi:DNA-binding PadR family transcriptional regulator